MPRQKSTHVDSSVAAGRRLKEARERAGLSQKALSFPGCSPAYISRIEAGDRIPSLQLLRELGKRLGVSEDFLATGAEPEPSARQALVDAELALRFDEVEEARRLYEAVLEGADDDAARAEALQGLGGVALREGRVREAVELLEDALGLAGGGGDPGEHPTLAESLGRAYGTLGELAPAIAIFENCVERFEREGSVIDFIRFACLLGYALTDNGDFAGAERIVARAVAAGRELQDPYTRARLYWSQSRLLGEQGSSDGATWYARLALESLRVTEDTYALGYAHQLLGSLYLDSDRVEEALGCLREGRRFIEATATPIDLAHYEIEEARGLAAIGEEEAAGALALSVASRLRDEKPVAAGRAYVLLGGVFERLGQSERAEEMYELSVELLEGIPPTRYLVDACKRLAALLEGRGKTDEALDVLKRALNVQERVGRSIH